MAATRQQAASLLRRYAVMLELLGEEPFRARTFENAARVLESQTQPLEVLVEEQLLAGLKGIGKTLTAAITSIYRTGTFEELEVARSQVPAGLLDLLRVEGLGPKRIRALWQSAQVTSLEELELALRRDTISKLPGFGGKLVQSLRQSVAFLKAGAGRHLRHHALRAAGELQNQLASLSGLQEIFFGGSLRRGAETVGDLDLLLIARPGQSEALLSQCGAIAGIEWLSREGRLWKGRMPSGIEIELSVVFPEEAPLRKFFATGSSAHVNAVISKARDQGFTLTAERLLDRAGVPVAVRSEDDIYRQLGIEPVPPPLREDSSTLYPLGTHHFPASVALSDLRGILHCHTTASDGHHALRDLALAMIQSGYEYLGVADHSQAAAYANGLSPERVRRQWREIDELNSELAPFRLLKGIEADILSDGRIDYDDDLLAGFDFVIASVHSGFNMTVEAATARIGRAMENPHVDLIGHPTGRLLLERPGYPVNHSQIIECAARHRKGIELNCNPHRLDLEWRWLPSCVEAGVPVPLCPDAHDLEGLADVSHGVAVAAKGPLPPKNCPSTWSADEFLDWCAEHAKHP